MSTLQTKIEQIKNELTVSNILEWQEQLENSCKTTLESFMCWSSGLDWDKEAVALVKYETLKNTMYYDDKIKAWLDK